jgi:hypothetical protein
MTATPTALLHGSLFSRHVIMAMTAVLANDPVAGLSPECMPGLWGAFAVSAGRLGVIIDVTLRIIPCQRNDEKRRHRDVDYRDAGGDCRGAG